MRKREKQERHAGIRAVAEIPLHYGPNKIDLEEIHMGGELFAEHAKADDEIGSKRYIILMADPGSKAPRQELWVGTDIGDQRV